MMVLKKYGHFAVLALTFVVVIAVLVSGCGTNNTDECTAPDGSSITIDPSSATWTSTNGYATGDIPNDWTVIVRYADGTPMPDACVTITGEFATMGSYQFFYYPMNTTPNTPADSGFVIQTDAFGKYTFSTLISSGTLSFGVETIKASSGTNIGKATLELK